jgi:hypothetical protein
VKNGHRPHHDGFAVHLVQMPHASERASLPFVVEPPTSSVRAHVKQKATGIKDAREGMSKMQSGYRLRRRHALVCTWQPQAGGACSRGFIRIARGSYPPGVWLMDGR